MAELEPYIPKEDGDLIKAEDWNEIQRRTRADIGRHNHTNRPLDEGEWRYGGQIPTDGLVDGAVTGSKIAEGAITDAKVADGAITGAKIGADAITDAKVADGAITAIKLDPSIWERLAGPPTEPHHFLMDCLEKKVQVYVTLHLFYTPRFPGAGFEGLREVAEAAQDVSVNRRFENPDDFVGAVAYLAGIELALAQGPLAHLVQTNDILDSQLKQYSGQITALQTTIEGLSQDSPKSWEDALEVARHANIVSMRAVLLVPSEPPPYVESPSKSLARQDVRVIEGVGPLYAERLKENGIKSVSQLSQASMSGLGVPWWLRYRARDALGVKIDKQAFAGLLDLTVSEVLSASDAKLARQSGQTATLVKALKVGMRVLRETLDDAFLDYCRLGDLVPVKK